MVAAWKRQGMYELAFRWPVPFHALTFSAATEGTNEGRVRRPSPTHRRVDAPSITESRQLDAFLSHSHFLTLP
jgi:hypothetical protein